MNTFYSVSKSTSNSSPIVTSTSATSGVTASPNVTAIANSGSPAVASPLSDTAQNIANIQLPSMAAPTGNENVGTPSDHGEGEEK